MSTWWLHLSSDPVASTNIMLALYRTRRCVFLMSSSQTATTLTPSGPGSCQIDAIFSPAFSLILSISSHAFRKLLGPSADPNLLQYFFHMLNTVPLREHLMYSFMTAEKDVQVARKKGRGNSGNARKKTFIFSRGVP